jgi:hypothetical protein
MIVYTFPRVAVTYTNGQQRTFGSYHSAATALSWRHRDFFVNLSRQGKVPADVQSIDYVGSPPPAPTRRAVSVRGYVCAIERGNTFSSPMVFRDTNDFQKYLHFEKDKQLSLESIKEALAGDGGVVGQYYVWYEMLDGGGTSLDASEIVDDQEAVIVTGKLTGEQRTFKSPFEAAAHLGCEKREIQRVLNGNRKSVKGHFVEYAR